MTPTLDTIMSAAIGRHMPRPDIEDTAANAENQALRYRALQRFHALDSSNHPDAPDGGMNPQCRAAMDAAGVAASALEGYARVLRGGTFYALGDPWKED